MKAGTRLLRVYALTFPVVCVIIHGKVFSASGKSRFEVDFHTAGITSLQLLSDDHNTNFIAEGKTLGNVAVRYRLGPGQWQEAMTSNMTDRRSVKVSSKNKHVVSYDVGDERQLTLTERFALEGDVFIWTLRFRNNTDRTLEIGDIALPLPMNTKYPKNDPEETFGRRLFRHCFISGNGSFVFWLPVSGIGPHLVMTPINGTKLEYFTESRSSYAFGGGDYVVFIHSAIDGEGEKHGTWRQKHTSTTLAAGEKVTYGFQFHWTGDYDAVRDILYDTGGFDVRVAPGMVVPQDLFAMFALRTKNKIDLVTSEFPTQTKLEYLGEKSRDVHIYKAKFSRLGENLLTVNYDKSKYLTLEFFVTQPLEVLIKKRAEFIAEKQQHRDPSKWYNGLFSLWDVRMLAGKNLLGPDNLGGQHRYAVSGSDDPSSGKPVYLSEKNVVYPKPEEITALEYYLEHFVWGKHQRTDKEHPYPYGIFGSDSWQTNRFAAKDLLSEKISRPGGPSQCRMWRTFDYTHYILLYYNMYRIAKQNPQMVDYLDANGYLERAFGTARAFFEVPYNIYMLGWAFTGWTDWAYKLGNFHEKYLLGLIEALEKEGQQNKADYLRDQWEKKVKFFIYDDPYPFTSEMPVDSTAYESSYAIAKYAMTHELKPDRKLWQDKNSGKWYSHPEIDPVIHEDFMRRQLLANLACRGWLETGYYHLGSDFRGGGSSGYTLSYMSQMGGWAILDYSLYFAKQPAEYLRLGYASMLSSWALVNAGNSTSNYGFWYPGKLHDGAVGWGFCPQKVGQEWNRGCRDETIGGVPRGPWPVCGEIDHGLTAGVEAACTVVLDDPVFGLFAYGGSLTVRDNRVSVICRDGVRQRLHFIKGNIRFHLSLNRDGFAKDTPVMFSDDLSTIKFSLENRSKKTHTTELTLFGLPSGSYTVLADDKTVQIIKTDKEGKTVLKMPVSVKAKPVYVILKKG